VITVGICFVASGWFAYSVTGCVPIVATSVESGRVEHDLLGAMMQHVAPDLLEYSLHPVRVRKGYRDPVFPLRRTEFARVAYSRDASRRLSAVTSVRPWTFAVAARNRSAGSRCASLSVQLAIATS
jgi:hypothetical protein